MKEKTKYTLSLAAIVILSISALGVGLNSILVACTITLEDPMKEYKVGILIANLLYMAIAFIIVQLILLRVKKGDKQ